MQGASLLALGIMSAAPARAGDFTFTSVDDDHIAWEDAANWAGPSALPGSGDDATIVSGLLRGAEVKDTRSVNTLVLDSGLNVYRGGKLTVGNGIVANAGYFINDGTIAADVVNNTYIANTGDFTGDVTNNSGGAVINDGVDDGKAGVWTGDVTNTDYVNNSYGIWNGRVLSNTGIIDNANGAIWNGDAVNSGDINSTDSVWNGDLANSGTAWMTGTLNGDVVNNGTLYLDKSLAGVGVIVNTGRIGMEDGAADDTLSARSLSGAGTVTIDFDPTTMSSDRVVLSGDYSADTALELRLLAEFPDVRKLGVAKVLVVGGKNSGSVTSDIALDDSGGAIVYAIEDDADGFAIVARPGVPVARAADVMALSAATLGMASPSGFAADEPCVPAATVRGFHGGATSSASGSALSLDVSGGAAGFDIACLALPNGRATLGLGVTLGLAKGSVRGDADAPPAGSMDQRFAGLYARLVDDAFTAVLEGQLASLSYRPADPPSSLGIGSLDGITSRFSSSASYSVALGVVSVTPEIGLSLTGSDARSGSFGNAGAVRLQTGRTVSAHVGSTIAAEFALAGGSDLTPFASLLLNGDLWSEGATLTDSASSIAAIDLAANSPYLTLAMGADLVHAGNLDAGLRADLRLGSRLTDANVSGHLKVSF